MGLAHKKNLFAHKPQITKKKKNNMADIGFALSTAKQALLLVAAQRKETILFGSCAADRYVPVSMRFGESYQDIDLFLVVKEGTPVESSLLDEFVRCVVKVLAGLPAGLLCADLLKWSVSMSSNGLYCAHVTARGCHISDITLIPERVNAYFENAYPRQACELYLSAFSAKLRLRVISIAEIFYRMESIISSSVMVDGLRCVSEECNKAAIVKSCRRLQRLCVLKDSSALRSVPSSWVFDLDYEFHALREQHARLGLYRQREAEKQDLGSGAECSAPRCEEREEREERKLTVDASSQASVGLSVEIEAIQAAFGSATDIIHSTEALMQKKLSLALKRLEVVEEKGQKLCTALNSALKRDRGASIAALRSATDTLNTFRTTTYMYALQPQAELRRVITAVERVEPALKEQARCSKLVSSIGDYYEPMAKIRKDMAERGYFPFNLILENEENEEQERALPGTVSGVCERDFWAVHELKKSLLGSFSVFLRMLTLARVMDRAETSKRGADVTAAEKVEAPEKNQQFRLPYAKWSEKVALMFELTKRVDAIREFLVPADPYMPFIHLQDGSLDFITVARERELLEIRKVLEMNDVVPSLDPWNLEFLMKAFENVIGHMTLPIITHVQALKNHIGALGVTVAEIKAGAEAYIEASAKAPAVNYAEVIRMVRRELYELAAKLEASSGNKEGSRFTWRMGVRKKNPVPVTLKKKRKGGKDSFS